MSSYYKLLFIVPINSFHESNLELVIASLFTDIDMEGERSNDLSKIKQGGSGEVGFSILLLIYSILNIKTEMSLESALICDILTLILER